MISLWLAFLLCGPTDSALTTDTYDAIRDEVLPAADEVGWLEIPWRSSFGDGLAAAAAEGRPVLLWAMNGHPLGCV